MYPLWFYRTHHILRGVTARTQKFGEPHRYTRSSSRAWLVRPWPSPDRCGVQGYHMANLVTGVRRRVVAKVIKIDFQNAYERNGGEKCVLRNVFFFWKDIRKDLHFAIPNVNYVWLWLLTIFRVLSKLGLQFLLSVLHVAWERETTRGIKSVLQVTGK